MTLPRGAETLSRLNGVGCAAVRVCSLCPKSATRPGVQLGYPAADFYSPARCASNESQWSRPIRRSTGVRRCRRAVHPASQLLPRQPDTAGGGNAVGRRAKNDLEPGWRGWTAGEKPASRPPPFSASLKSLAVACRADYCIACGTRLVEVHRLNRRPKPPALIWPSTSPSTIALITSMTGR